MGSLRLHDPPPLVARLVAAPMAVRGELLRATPVQHGGLTTFVFLGRADRVDVEHFMARFPVLPPLEDCRNDVHAVTVRLPDGARLEYKLAVTNDGTTDHLLDPLNPRRATDPYGANSVAWAPGYIEPWWVSPGDGPGGEVRRGYVDSAAFGERRWLHWYSPPGGGHDLPLLVVHDGADFIHHAGIVTVLDNLIGAGVIPPVAAALIDPIDRLVEYADDPRHAAFVAEVAAAASRRHGADPDPMRRVLLGASFGAVGALSAAWRTGPVGGLVLLSGSFVTALGGPMHRGAIFLPVIDFMERFTSAPEMPSPVIYQACGAYEGLAPDNRAFRPVLEATGARVAFEEVRDGHHWHNWRDRLGAGLVHALGTPTATPGTVRA